MTLPVQKPERRWRLIVGWSLLVFAGGLAAGPPVHDFVFGLIDQAAPRLAASSPQLFGWLDPVPPLIEPTSRKHVKPIPTLPERAPAAPVAAPIAARPPRQPAAVEPAAVVAATASDEPARAAPAAAARAQSPRGGAKPAPTAKPGPVAVEKKPGKGTDPFDTDADDKPARKPKPVADEPLPVKSEPAPKPVAARSGDSLDNLMSDVMTDAKGKGKKGGTKGLDAMLKDVQKSNPAPVVKREEPAAAEPLSSAEIAQAMTSVKKRASECAQRLGQQGLAELKIVVSKEGKVTDVRVGGKVGNTPLGSCIDKAVRATTFRPNTGLRFDYRIDAR